MELDELEAVRLSDYEIKSDWSRRNNECIKKVLYKIINFWKKNTRWTLHSKAIKLKIHIQTIVVKIKMEMMRMSNEV